ncbi:MAG: ornithine cyclodeaminase family protein [Deltaproteobacteria bacterium]|nr:ornithine cyclodeaminase family protein [Deltaproteobacteria bacterium]
MIYLSNRDISQLLTPKHCIDALADAFHALAQGQAVSRPRTDVWVPCGRSDGYYRWGSMEGAVEPMGIFVTRMKSDIVTWTKEGTDELHCVRPGTFSGFLMAFSTRNGEPLAIMNDGVLHHLRVAAGAALGMQYLAREDVSVVGILGSGGMARAYLSAFCEVRHFSRAKVYSPTKAHREAYAEEMSREIGIPVEPYDRPEPVVRGSDIVATCTDATGLVVTDPSWIEKGMHLTNVSSKEWGWDVVQLCDLVVQVGAETLGTGMGKEDSERHYGWATWMIGRPDEIARIPKRPVSNTDFLKYPSLIDLLSDPSKRRASPDQITFFHNLGLLGFQFAAVAGKAYTLAREKGIGLKISTEPFLQDIRD